MVVEDKKPAPPPNAKSSVAAGGQPEPGRDIFAEKVVKDQPSQAAPPPANPPQVEEKEISAVAKPSVVVVEDLKEDAKQDVAADEPLAGSLEEGDGVAAKVAEELYPTKEKVAEVPVKEQDVPLAAAAAAGPLEEDEAVAEKVAQELYPEGAD